MADENRTTHAKHFDRVHSAQLQSQALQDIWRNAYGDEYPAEVNPSAFYARSTLRQLVSGLQIEPGQTVVDLGCGNGGAGLWVAQELGAKLIGIDLSPAGVAAGTESAKAMGLGDTARFLAGDLTATGLDSASCDGALSLDVLCFVPDKPAALREIARILRPGARFGFTTWEQEGYSERLKAAQLTDHRPALEEAGFEVESYEEPVDWRQQQKTVLEGLLASEQKLADELDPPNVDRFMGLARGMLSDMPARRYVSVLARRR
jgi:SAM-dependent methyltransferase